jgi:hypothetical protein
LLPSADSTIAVVRLTELWERFPADARQVVISAMTRMVQQALPVREANHD